MEIEDIIREFKEDISECEETLDLKFKIGTRFRRYLFSLSDSGGIMFEDWVINLREDLNLNETHLQRMYGLSDKIYDLFISDDNESLGLLLGFAKELICY